MRPVEARKIGVRILLVPYYLYFEVSAVQIRPKRLALQIDCKTSMRKAIFLKLVMGYPRKYPPFCGDGVMVAQWSPKFTNFLEISTY